MQPLTSYSLIIYKIAVTPFGVGVVRRGWQWFRKVLVKY